MPLDSNALWKKMRKYAGAEHLEWPLKLGNDGEGEDLSTGALDSLSLLS